MVNAFRVGASVLRYRGGTGQWAWAVNRVAGLGVLLFLLLHIFDIFVGLFGPGLFNDLLFLYKGLYSRIGEIFLAFGLIYHGLNGLRTTVADWDPRLASLKTNRRLFNIQLVLFFLIFAPAGFAMMYTLPPEMLGGNVVIATIVTLLVLLIPAAIVLAAQMAPAAFAPAGNVGGGNYEVEFQKILRGPKSPNRRNNFEFYMWLFMRLSGVVLIVMALFHLFWMHFAYGVENMSFNTLVERWNDPADPLGGLFWRTYDLILLLLAFTHGVNGARMVLGDYVHSRGWRFLVMAGLALLWVTLLAMGVSVIFFFQGRPA